LWKLMMLDAFLRRTQGPTATATNQSNLEATIAPELEA
jgi:hypothetical protein